MRSRGFTAILRSLQLKSWGLPASTRRFGGNCHAIVSASRSRRMTVRCARAHLHQRRAAMLMDHTVMDHTVIADVSARIAMLFLKLPMLTGFSVQERATLTRDRDTAPLTGDLCVADVSVDAWAGFQAAPAVQDEIVQALLELLSEHPGSCEVLR